MARRPRIRGDSHRRGGDGRRGRGGQRGGGRDRCRRLADRGPARGRRLDAARRRGAPGDGREPPSSRSPRATRRSSASAPTPRSTSASAGMVARAATAGIARAVDPIFTPVDGDVAFCLASGRPASRARWLAMQIGAGAATATAAAIRDAVAPRPRGGTGRVAGEPRWGSSDRPGKLSRCPESSRPRRWSCAASATARPTGSSTCTRATRGRIGAIAKGSRRPKSRFGGRLEPFFRLDLILYEGRSDLLHGHRRLDDRGLFPVCAATAMPCRPPAAPATRVLRLFDTGEPNRPAYNLLVPLPGAARRRSRPPRARPGRGARLPPEARPRGRVLARAGELRALRRGGAPDIVLRRRRRSRLRGLRGRGLPALRGAPTSSWSTRSAGRSPRRRRRRTPSPPRPTARSSRRSSTTRTSTCAPRRRRGCDPDPAMAGRGSRLCGSTGPSPSRL